MSTFGGLLGEIVIVFTAIQDYVNTLSVPLQHKFTSEHFETFLLTLIERDVIQSHMNLALNNDLPEEPLDE